MATWTTRIRTITRHEWVVPMYSGSNDHAQLLQAIHEARRARAEQLTGTRYATEANLSDDAVMVSAGDDEIVIWYETDVVT